MRVSLALQPVVFEFLELYNGVMFLVRFHVNVRREIRFELKAYHIQNKISN